MPLNRLRERDQALEKIQDRVLWLAAQMVHHANRARPNGDDLKVGGHQASSASVATIMTALYFDFMRAGDRIAVKPHASPVFHAIQYLLGGLDAEYLKTLRSFRGLQAYPSRTKDPDRVDFSTGSVGIGAVAPNFAALVEEYSRSHFDRAASPDAAAAGRRYISLVRDAELNEGSVWEAIAEPCMSGLRNVLWVVDLNRQSLDRIIPGIRVQVWREMFAANGWTVVDAKYGTRLQAAFEESGGDLLRGSIDGMSNELYQRLLRLAPAELREWLPRTSGDPESLRRFIGRWTDQALQDVFRNLGGHDFASGALVPEAIRAAAGLEGEGVFANVINVTGPGPLYGRYQAHVRAAVDGTRETPEFLSEIVPADERSASIVTVVDGHPHTLAWLGGALSAKTLALGVTEFGQSGSPDDLYREYRIDATSIMGACFSALGS